MWHDSERLEKLPSATSPPSHALIAYLLRSLLPAVRRPVLVVELLQYFIVLQAFRTFMMSALAIQTDKDVVLPKHSDLCAGLNIRGTSFCALLVFLTSHVVQYQN